MERGVATCPPDPSGIDSLRVLAEQFQQEWPMVVPRGIGDGVGLLQSAPIQARRVVHAQPFGGRHA